MPMIKTKNKTKNNNNNDDRLTLLTVPSDRYQIQDTNIFQKGTDRNIRIMANTGVT